MKRRSDSVLDSQPTSKRSSMSAGDAMQIDGAPSGAGAVEIDLDLHSRQIAVYGKAAMQRLATASVLVIGAKGLGQEVGALRRAPQW
jgi:ubiquitin-activating enzyme E1